MTNAEVAEQFDILPTEGWSTYIGRSSLAGLSNPADDGEQTWTPEHRRVSQRIYKRRKDLAKREKPTWVCQFCGQQFPGRDRTSRPKYCSRACADAVCHAGTGLGNYAKRRYFRTRDRVEREHARYECRQLLLYEQAGL